MTTKKKGNMTKYSLRRDTTKHLHSLFSSSQHPVGLHVEIPCWTEWDIKAAYKQCMTSTLHPVVEPTVLCWPYCCLETLKNKQESWAQGKGVELHMVLISCPTYQLPPRCSNKTIMWTKITWTLGLGNQAYIYNSASSGVCIQVSVKNLKGFQNI